MNSFTVSDVAKESSQPELAASCNEENGKQCGKFYKSSMALLLLALMQRFSRL